MECPRCHFANSSERSACEKCGLPLPKTESFTKTQTLETTFCGLALGSLVAGRYQVLEELGSGGMGRVYKVFDRETREELALKLLRSDIIRDDRAVERFRHELKIAHQVSHRNICRIYHLGREDSSLFIVMEYVPGEDLKSFIRRSGQLSAGKAVFLARQVCEGLGEAHRLGIVHRDLKPHNIMIDTDGNAKIMDFGIARSLREEGLTRAGYAVGTPSYMAPEQIEGKEVDERTDIYALGAVLYEMVTGKPPFQGDTDFSVAAKHLNVEPADPATLNPLIPAEMSRIILKCLQKDKRHRFQNAAELCAALSQIETRIGPTPAKLRLKALEPRPRIGRRNLLVVTAVVLAAVTLSVFIYFKYIRDHGRNAGGGESRGPSGWKNSIAVLPFQDLSPGRTPEYICDGLTDDIQTKLSSTGEFQVASGLSTRLSAGQEKDPREIGKKLGVANILEASVQTRGDELQVNVRLVPTKDGLSLWGNNYTEAVPSILKLESDISADVTVQLGVGLTPENRAKSRRKDPKDIKDYELFLMGRHFEKKFGDYDDEQDFSQAVEKLKAYIDAHPDFALAYFSLGNVYEHRFALKNDPADGAAMRLSWDKAYQLDPNLEETNLGMGWSCFYRQDYDRSYGYFQKAVSLGPDNSEVDWNVGSFFRSIGLDEKALVCYQKALVTDPLNPSIHAFCAASFLYVGQYEKGLNSIEKAIALDPENVLSQAYSVRLLLLLRRFDEAERRLGGLAEDVRKQKPFRQVRALISALHKDRESALASLRENRLLYQDGESAYGLTVSSVYALLGMKSEAVRAIEEGIRKGFDETKMELYCYPLLRSYPYFGGLNSAPEFQAVQERQKKIYELRMEKYKDL
jgi:serine/threonine protein kinase/tetratricopeptide (TPR) repeat protein